MAHIEEEDCIAEVGDNIGRWPHYRRCANRAKHDVMVKTHQHPYTDERVFVARLCGTHKRFLENGGLLHLITGPRRERYPHDWTTTAVKKARDGDGEADHQ